MDIGEITKVANRKRLSADAEKLREKVSRETAKIIKLKVAQDTAYWDLKEKLQQVEGNHERLQQNMVEVQMQHEAISGQYQDELGLRPDTLNKLGSTREICDVLEDYSERLKETLSRCKGDQASLCDAYRRCGLLVRQLRIDTEKNDGLHRQLIDSLQDKVKITSEHQNQLVQYLSAAKQQADVELTDVKGKLCVAQARAEELCAGAGELRRQLEQSQQDLQQKDATITRIDKENQDMLQEFTTQANKMKEIIQTKESQLVEATETIESLKRAIANVEEFLATVRDKNSALMEQLAETMEQLETARNDHQLLLTDMQNVSAENENIKNVAECLRNEKDTLEKMIEGKNQVINDAETQITNMKETINNIEKEKIETATQLTETQVQLETATAQLLELQEKFSQLEKSRDEEQASFTAYRDQQEAKVKELLETLTSKDKELDCKAGTIAQLMGEVGSAADAVAKLEASLQKMKKEMDEQRDAGKVKDEQHAVQVERLQAGLADKESELSKQMTVILDMRNEKERLHEKIEGMQSKIDNIQKELSAPQHMPPPALAAELDDNAVPFALTPTPLTGCVGKLGPQKGDKNCDLGIMSQKPVRVEPRIMDNMLFGMFSDSSMDGDNMIDPREVNRRFEALSRGERISPAPLSALKRKAKMLPPQPRPSKLHANDDDDDLLSLSQVKSDLKNKEQRTFFKSKRADNKIKRIK